MNRIITILLTSIFVFITVPIPYDYTSATLDQPDDVTDEQTSNVSTIIDTMEDEANSDGDVSFWLFVIVVAVIIIVLMGFSFYSYKRTFVKQKRKS